MCVFVKSTSQSGKHESTLYYKNQRELSQEMDDLPDDVKTFSRTHIPHAGIMSKALECIPAKFLDPNTRGNDKLLIKQDTHPKMAEAIAIVCKERGIAYDCNIRGFKNPSDSQVDMYRDRLGKKSEEPVVKLKR